MFIIFQISTQDDKREMKKTFFFTIFTGFLILLGTFLSAEPLRKWRTQSGGENVLLASEENKTQIVGDISKYEIKETPRFGVGQKAGERKVLELKGIAYAFRWCPAGSFIMGSPQSEEGRSGDETPHEVILTEGFWLLETPVTQEMWESVMGTTISEQRDKAYKGWSLYGVGKKHPMYYVSWEECQKFCWEISEEAGERITLPTEAQWEYACRAGSETALYTGAIKIKGYRDAPALDEISWYGGNSSQGYEGEGADSRNWIEVQYPGSPSGTHPVGEKKANAWGLCDTLGNVYEWCGDWFGAYPSGSVTDPEGSENGSYRVFRGGSWNSYAGYCRSAFRYYCGPGTRHDNVGFRVLLSPIARNIP